MNRGDDQQQVRGLSYREMIEVLRVSRATTERDTRHGRAWLPIYPFREF